MATNSIQNKAKIRYSIIGAGKVATTLAQKLQDNGLLDFVYLKNPNREKSLLSFGIEQTKITDKFEFITNSNCIIIAVNDSAIPDVVEKLNINLCNLPEHNQFIFHTSGFVPALALKQLADKGINVFAAHPVQTFFYPNQDLLKGITWNIENYNTDPKIIETIIKDLDGSVQFLSPDVTENKELYHLISVIASNFVTTTIEFSKLIAGDLKITDLTFLSNLIKTTTENCIRNINDKNVPLTGPIARKDYNAIKGYLDKIAYNTAFKSILINYLSANLEILYQKGIYNQSEKQELEQIIKKYQ